MIARASTLKKKCDLYWRWCQHVVVETDRDNQYTTSTKVILRPRKAFTSSVKDIVASHIHAYGFVIRASLEFNHQRNSYTSCGYVHIPHGQGIADIVYCFELS